MEPATILGLVVCLPIYPLLLHPLLLWLGGAHRPEAEEGWEDSETSVTVIVPMVDEVPALEDCLGGLRAQHRPPDRVVVVVDDVRIPPGLESIVGAAEEIPFPIEVRSTGDRRGKTAAQQLAIAVEMPGDQWPDVQTRVEANPDEVLVFTDVSARLAPDALSILVPVLADRGVGVVTGALDYEGEGLERVYRRWENRLKSLSSRFHGCVGATGPLYALRRRDYVPLPDEALADLVLPLMVELRTGRPTRFVARARVRELVVSRPESLEAMKARIHHRVLVSLPLVLGAAHPLRRPRLAFLLLSQKLPRWLFGPWVVLVILLGAALPAPAPLLAGGMLVALALGPRILPVEGVPGALLYGIILVRAQFLGTWRWIRRSEVRSWSPSFSPRGGPSCPSESIRGGR